MRITSLASGSSGNSFLIRDDGAAIVVDAGLSGKQMADRLTKAGCDPEQVDAILVSHGHTDHTKGVGVLSRRYKLPVWINSGTRRVAGKSIGSPHKVEIFETGKIFHVAGFKVHPFSVPHDCADPVGFRISRGDSAIGIATDLGTATGLVMNILTGLDVVVLESNHDPQMLRDGPYPWELKQRVRSRVGHLSNPDSSKLLRRIVSDKLKGVILAHVSETNNHPDLALDCARRSLTDFLENEGILHCAVQNEVGPTIHCRNNGRRA
jgi:phosphoribosyl 1,2-cyclic phosphodiesterase